MLRGVFGSGGGAPVGGSGTPNTIPRWTGATTLGDSGLIDNGTAIYTTTRNVGIGTATPVGRADVAGTSVNQSGWGLLSVQSNDAQGADKGGSITFGGVYDASSATHWAQISGRKENGTSGQYGGYLAFATRTNGAGTNTERARIDSSGNVGIGTASPAYRLSVTASAAQIGVFSTTDASSGFIEWRYGGGNAGYIGNGASILTGASATDFIVRSAGALKFATNGNNLRATIDASGNVYGTSGTTGMTDGFFYIPGAAGAPTGTPTAVSGRVPMYYDTTNNQFYVYNGAWKKVTLA